MKSQGAAGPKSVEAGCKNCEQVGQLMLLLLRSHVQTPLREQLTGDESRRMSPNSKATEALQGDHRLCEREEEGFL